VILILILLAFAVGVGFLAGGSLEPLQRLRIHWWGAALAGLALQGVPLTIDLGPWWGPATLLASYALLLAFAWVNRRLPALWLVIAGLAMNLLVIGVNWGMPVSAGALEAAGAGPERLGEEGTLKHHLMGPDDVLTPLADVIGIPEPVGTVVSVGDLFLYAGVAGLIVSVMLGYSAENRRPPPRRFPGYRGKHLPPERRFSRLGPPHARRAGGEASGTGR
jgi:Family of unknown function (DUF5317)